MIPHDMPAASAFLTPPIVDSVQLPLEDRRVQIPWVPFRDQRIHQGGKAPDASAQPGGNNHRVCRKWLRRSSCAFPSHKHKKSVVNSVLNVKKNWLLRIFVPPSVRREVKGLSELLLLCLLLLLLFIVHWVKENVPRARNYQSCCCCACCCCCCCCCHTFLIFSFFGRF